MYKNVTSERHSRWAVILAGGEGKRLRRLTQAIAGDDRPKQFCAVTGQETLLEQTVKRVAQVVEPDHTRVILTRHHKPFYERYNGCEAESIVQPANRGTAPAILYGLLSIDAQDPEARVAVFPSDHHYSDEHVLVDCVEVAFQSAAARRDLVILLGVVPTSAETDYGWIQPGTPVNDVPAENLCRVRRFEEKPPPEVARRLFASGGLWNSFVLVGTVQTLLHLFANSVPDLFCSFEPVEREIGTIAEPRAAEAAYRGIRSVDFSQCVLETHPDALSVLPMDHSGWTDMGSVPRVLSVLAGRTSASHFAD